MENLEIIFSLFGTALSLLVTCLFFIIKFIKSVHTKNKLKDNTAILEAVAPLMEIAEKFRHYSGEEKKEFVLTKLNQFSLENNLAFDAEAIDKKIEELIKLTKQVNSKNQIGE